MTKHRTGKATGIAAKPAKKTAKGAKVAAGSVLSQKAVKSGVNMARIKVRSRPKLKMPSETEDAAINAAIVADPDTFEAPDLSKARRGRPKLDRPKQPVSLRLDADVIDAFKDEGPGWQGRMNRALRKAAGLK